MIKGTLLTGLLWLGALGLAAPAAALGAPQHAIAELGAASAGCLGAPGSWGPATLRLEQGRQAPVAAPEGRPFDRSPERPDCALV